MQSHSTGAQEDQGEPLDPKKPSSFENIAMAIGSRNLIIIIVAMPLVFLAVLTAIIVIFGGGDDVETTAAAPDSVAVERIAEPAPAAGAFGGASASSIGVPAGGDITAMSLDGDRIALRVDGPNGVSIVIYDIAAGKVVQRIPVTQGSSN